MTGQWTDKGNPETLKPLISSVLGPVAPVKQPPSLKRGLPQTIDLMAAQRCCSALENKSPKINAA